MSEENDLGAQSATADAAAGNMPEGQLPHDEPRWSAIDATKADFYERRLREEWKRVGGTVRGTWFYHSLLPGLGCDSRSCWANLVWAAADAGKRDALTLRESGVSRPGEKEKDSSAALLPAQSTKGQSKVSQR